MPNHVMNKVTFMCSEEKKKDIFETIKGEYGVIDFEKIIHCIVEQKQLIQMGLNAFSYLFEIYCTRESYRIITMERKCE